MLEQRIMHGKTAEQIAKDFNVAPSTVNRAMSLAAKGDLIIGFEDKLHQELIPLAHEALVGALKEGNAKVALEIFKGTNLLKKTQTPSKQQQQDADDLSAYIFSRRVQSQLEEQPIDVTPVPLALPSAASTPDSPGSVPPARPAEGPAAPAPEPCPAVSPDPEPDDDDPVGSGTIH